MLSRDRENLGVNRCKSCGFVYLASWEQSLAKSPELYGYYGRLTEEDLTRRYSPENRARQQELLRVLARYTHGRTLLDVGCGDGQLLRTANEEGWNAVGIDLSDAAILLCHRRGLNASTIDFFDPSLDDRRFDVIVMSELIEHVPSPQRFLRRAEDLLKDEGVLWLTTPNFGSLARRMLGQAWSVIHVEHIGYFERSTLRRMVLAETSLRQIRIEANNIAPSTFVAWLRGRGTQAARRATEVHVQARRGLDQRLRGAVHRSRVLGASKDLLNRVISQAGLGDTLVGWFQKPPT